MLGNSIDTSAVEEPQDQTWHVASVGGKDWQIVVAHTGIGVEDHFRGECVMIQPLMSQNAFSAKVEIAVVIAIRRCPWKSFYSVSLASLSTAQSHTSFDDRTNDLIDFLGAVFQE